MAAVTRVAVALEQCWHRVPGGTARAAIETAAAISAYHPDIEQIGVSAWHRGPPTASFEPPIATKAVLLPRLAMYEAWHRFGRPLVERTTGPISVVHATGLAVPPSKAPLVFTLHDLAWRRDPSAFTHRGLRFFEAALERAREHAVLVLCSSQATVDDARDAGFDPSRLRLVPLGVNPTEVPDGAVDEVRARHGIRGRYVLSVGTAEPRKNLARLLEAFARLDGAQYDDVQLVLVGPSGWQVDLAALLEPLGDRVRTLGFVTPDDLTVLYRGASVFAYPSLWEGFGLPVLEALSQGAPVLTSAGTSCAEVAGDAAELVDPTSVEAVSAGLVRLLDDQDRSNDLRRRGPLRAEQFSWQRTAELTVAAYREAER